MFNLHLDSVLQSLVRLAPATLLADLCGQSERTWRNRLKNGWVSSEEKLCALQESLDLALIKRLVDDGGWTDDEASAIWEGRPSAQGSARLPTADLIYFYSPCTGKYCQESIALASRLDLDCEVLYAAAVAGDVGSARAALEVMLDWLLVFYSTPSDRATCERLRSEFNAMTDMTELLNASAPLGQALLFHVLACWDVEFCAGYFEGTMQAQPLFTLVMPRFSPDIEIDFDTGSVLRNGEVPRQRFVESSRLRLMDFFAVLIGWARTGELPHWIPGAKDLSEWCNEELTRVYSWRDGTTHLTLPQIAQMWTSALTPDSSGIYPAIPLPLVVCANLWAPQLELEEHSISVTDRSEEYLRCWQTNHDRLVAGGLRFGEQAWPAYWVSRTDAVRKSPLSTANPAAVL